MLLPGLAFVVVFAAVLFVGQRFMRGASAPADYVRRTWTDEDPS